MRQEDKKTMTLSPTDVIQSFRLRFWRESRQGISGDWRGDVWHEQQKPGEEPVAVASPQAAFELVTDTLQRFSAKLDAETRSSARPEEDGLSPASSGWAPLLAFWRGIRGTRP
jgi:hypothetical protein